MPDGNHTATPATVPITFAKSRKNLLAGTTARYVDPSTIDLTNVRPCPFCADAKSGGAVVEYRDDACEPPLSYRYACMGCAAEGPSRESAAEALQSWNSRAAFTLEDLPRLSDEDREAADSGYVALEGVPAVARSEHDVWAGVDDLYAARSILELYIKSIPDKRADDRYVLWAVRDKIDEANDTIQQALSNPAKAPSGVAHG